ncbi:MAG: HEPN domain-containing protein [Theionarchaea archaeon]|nr:HEPN domain-containing protein [Theionarchaea archaeon]
MKEATQRWLKKAKEDLADAKFSISGSRYNLGGFMLQQALEKALKALHLEKYDKFEYTHNLVRLSADFDIPEKYQRICEILTPLYTGFRYPDVAEGNVENIDEILEIAEEMIQWIEKRFNV